MLTFLESRRYILSDEDKRNINFQQSIGRSPNEGDIQRRVGTCLQMNLQNDTKDKFKTPMQVTQFNFQHN